MTEHVAQRLAEVAARIEGALIARLDRLALRGRDLAEALRHPLLAGGKRLRPALVLECARAVGGDEAEALPGALAVELVHTYSLVHDDLPCMDDDDLRRGRPTVHKLWGEALGVLVGDGLQSLAFEVLLEGPAPAARSVEAGRVLARAIGVEGMVGGQVLDLEAEGAPADLEAVRAIHERKTMALIRASCELGAVLGGAGEAERAALVGYGRACGLAFQIVDDVLDETATAGELGKSPGKDRAAGKATWPARVGLEAAKEAARSLAGEARAALRSGNGMDLCTGMLDDLTHFIVDRRL